MHTLYILLSLNKKNWSYVGSTSNIQKRIKDHNFGKTTSTKAFRPLKIVYTENFNTKEEAYKRELYYKSGIGRESKKFIIDKYYSEIV